MTVGGSQGAALRSIISPKTKIRAGGFKVWGKKKRTIKEGYRLVLLGKRNAEV